MSVNNVNIHVKNAFPQPNVYLVGMIAKIEYYHLLVDANRECLTVVLCV